MLKKRIIPVLLLLNGRMVKGKNFQNYIDTGIPSTQVKIYNSQDADELIFLNISRERNEDLQNILKIASKECFIPLSAGGNIRNLTDVKNILDSGADKVVLNTNAYNNRTLVKEIVNNYGFSTLIISIDYKIINNEPVVFVNCGKENTSTNLFEYIKEIEDIGVGELMITAIDNEGLKNGYDIDIAKKISDFVHTPLIFNGGAGNFNHFIDLLSISNINAAACSSLFHFGDNNPIRARSYLKNNNIKMRNLK